MRSTARNLTIALAVATLAACGGGDGGDSADDGGSAGGETTVTLSDFEIDAPRSVPAGTTLTVVNDGDVPHNFTAEEGADFATEDLEGGAEGSVTVDGSGTVSYLCTLHPGQMTGTLEITEG